MSPLAQQPNMRLAPTPRGRNASIQASFLACVHSFPAIQSPGAVAPQGGERFQQFIATHMIIRGYFAYGISKLCPKAVPDELDSL